MKMRITEKEEKVILTLYSEKRYSKEIKEALEEREAGSEKGRYRVMIGTLYKMLGNLEKKGVIESEWGQNKGQERRRYYRLTELGVIFVHERMACNII